PKCIFLTSLGLSRHYFLADWSLRSVLSKPLIDVDFWNFWRRLWTVLELLNNKRVEMSMMMKRLVLPAVALIALTFGGLVSRATEPVSFGGKTVTMIIGSAPGGGTDASGRVIARFLGDYLPGKPAVIVKNIPGAQGMTSMNYFANQVPHDGLTL